MTRRELAKVIGIICLVILVTTLFFMSACAKPAPPAPAPAPAPQPQMKPVVWTMAANISKGNTTEDLFVANYLFSRLMFEETGGLISIELKDQLFPPKETFFAVADGRAQIGHITHNNHIGDQPLWGLPLLPGLYENGAQMILSWLYDPAIQKMYQDSHNAKGVQMIAFYSPPPQALWCKKSAIAKVEDFKGKKVRCSSALQTLAVEPLGASSVTVPFGELFTAYERGVIDAAITSVGAGTSLGLQSISAAVIDWPITPTQPYIVAANKKTFDALPKDMQDAVMRVGYKTSLMMAYTMNMEWQKSIKIAEASKVQILTPSAEELKKFRELASKSWDSWLKDTGPEGQRWLDTAKAWIAKEATQKWVYKSW